MKKFKKVLFIIAFIFPFILGCIGFVYEGENILDAAYNSFALYAVNPLYTTKNGFIEVSRWLAPAVLASGVVVFIKELSQRIKDFFISSKNNSFTLYGNYKEIVPFKNLLPHTIISNNEKISNSDNHIIMFENDSQSFDFYNDNKNEFSGKNVFIKSDRIEMFRNTDDNFRIINVNEMISRNYWIKYNLVDYFKNNQKEIDIAFIGFGAVGQKLLDYAVLNNIFSLDQKITYHIWGEANLYSSIHSNINLMNDDYIIYHSGSWKSNIDSIKSADRIIVLDPIETDTLIMLSDVCAESEIHCYNVNENIISFLDNPKTISFGKTSDVITRDNIMLNDIYRSAKLLNLHYVYKYTDSKENADKINMETEWKKLDAFTKNSNICAADYHIIRKIITEKTPKTTMELAEMEHIRWCRFHFLNHWKYGMDENGKKDKKNKLHPSLIPFDDLSQEEKEKDISAIQALDSVINSSEIK